MLYDFIDFVPGDRIVFQNLVFPVAHEIEHPERVFFDEVAEPLQDFFPGLAIVHRQSLFVISANKNAHGDMGVGIDDAGHDEFAAKVNLLARLP